MLIFKTFDFNQKLSKNTLTGNDNYLEDVDCVIENSFF